MDSIQATVLVGVILKAEIAPRSDQGCYDGASSRVHPWRRMCDP